jgi:dipeptidyl aminopeptidase/acylaminoacyl peptidase
MNLLKPTIMASLMALTLSTACNKADSDGKIIEKSDVKIENGQFTPEVLEALGRVSEPQVSPDGKKVLYGVSYESVEQDKSNRELWVMDIDGKNAEQITKTASSEQNAVWIDGGKKIAFLYKDGDNTQLWTMDADGSSRECISKVEKGIDGFVLSPDEKKIVFISQVKYGKTAQDYYPDLKDTKAKVITDLMYKHWDEWVTTIPHPFVADFDGSKLSGIKDILEGEPYESPMKPWGGIESLAWTPDSKSIVYVSRKKVGKAYALSTNSDLYKYDIETGKTTNLTEGMMGYDTCPTYSKSGSKIAWLSMEHDGYESDKNRIFVMDTKTGQKTDLTAKWDYAVDAIAWSPDEKYIYFIAPYQGTVPLFRVEVATQKIDTIDNGQYDYASILPVGNDSVITLRHSFLTPNEIFSIKVGAKPVQISKVNDDVLAKLTPITVEKRMIPTTDGKSMTTWVLLPPNFDKNKKYPAILYCEGGPQSPVSQFWSFRWNLRLMASQGYIVIAPNRRGLPGFGTEWNAEISKDYGGQNMKDYLSAVDFMKKEPYVDGAHIGAVGASYGGYSVYWLAGNHNHRFACFIAHAGIFNLEAQYLETEEMWFANWDLGGPFWDKSNAAAQRTYATASPHRFVQNWDTPIMVTVGENDYRIVFTQGAQAFNAAILRGIPARMVIFPDEDHWIQKPQNAILWQREFFGWLDRWLKPGSEAAKKAAAEKDSVKCNDNQVKK